MPLILAIKQRMEKDIDEVGKIARLAKSKLEELDKDVCFLTFKSNHINFSSYNIVKDFSRLFSSF